MIHLPFFGLRNFKCFEGEQHFHLKDITFLIGKNSSGKSSLIQALRIVQNDPQKLDYDVELGLQESWINNNIKNKNEHPVCFSSPSLRYIDYRINSRFHFFQPFYPFKYIPFYTEILSEDERTLDFKFNEEYNLHIFDTRTNAYKINEYFENIKPELQKLNQDRNSLIDSFLCYKIKSSEEYGLFWEERDYFQEKLTAQVSKESNGYAKVRGSSSDCIRAYIFLLNNAIEFFETQNYCYDSILEKIKTNKFNFDHFDEYEGIRISMIEKTEISSLYILLYSELNGLDPGFKRNKYDLFKFTENISKNKGVDWSLYKVDEDSLFYKYCIPINPSLKEDLMTYGHPLKAYRYDINIKYLSKRNYSSLLQIALLEYYNKSGDNYSRHLYNPNIIADLDRQINLFNKYLKYFELGDDFSYEKLEVNGQLHFELKIIRDLESNLVSKSYGFGVQSILPILFTVVFNSSNQVVILEEPEANLHPALQSKLADFLVEASQKLQIQFIIETHSEYIIRRMQYLMAHTHYKPEEDDIVKVKPENANIYYFNDPGKVKRTVMNREEYDLFAYEINFNADGSLSRDFGPGFFDEATNITMDMINLRRGASNN